jgi:RNA polymerase sigma-70 factor (ECF subfamily)
MAVYYVDVEGFRYQDIANVMGAPVRTAMSRLYRGRTLLRKALAEPAAE